MNDPRLFSAIPRPAIPKALSVQRHLIAVERVEVENSQTSMDQQDTLRNQSSYSFE
jgi:hypothetical protein